MGAIKPIILYWDKLNCLISIISIKFIYYYTNYSIWLLQGGWHGPTQNCISHSLHVTGPSHCPRIYEPHPAFIASTRPAVARCAWKQVAQMVRNRACVPNWHKRKFSQDILNRDDIQDKFSVWDPIDSIVILTILPKQNDNIIYIIRIILIIRIMWLINIIRLIRIIHK